MPVAVLALSALGNTGLVLFLLSKAKKLKHSHWQYRGCFLIKICKCKYHLKVHNAYKETAPKRGN
jgi:hypothetical protein